MEKKKQEKDSKEAVFKRLYGVKPETFEKMASILQKEWNKLHRTGGRPSKLTIPEKLTLTLDLFGNDKASIIRHGKEKARER
jgi:hypothetical protein